MASSFHLWWKQLPVATFNEMSVILRVVQKPAASLLVYWAGSVSFRQTDGSYRGGAHFGLQTAQDIANDTKTAVNWGGYDDVLGGAEFRGSISPLPPSTTVNSPLYEWHPDRDYLMRVWKSPKQNWTAAELNTGGDQAAGEIAWRFTVTDLSTGVETFVRDLLVPNCHTTAALVDPVMWGEDFNDGDAPTATVAWDVRWTEPRVDGRLATKVEATYPGVLTNTNSDTYDRVGFRQRSVTGRSVPNGTFLDLPGPAVRSATVASLGEAPAAETITLTVPSDTLGPSGDTPGDLLLAFIANHTAHNPPSSPGWERFTPAVLGIRHTVLYRRHDGSTMSHVFTGNVTTNSLSGVLVAMYGADPFAPPRLGDAELSPELVNTWTAPAMEKKTNYGKVLASVAAEPASGGGNVSFNVGAVEVGDSTTISGNWSMMAVAQEPTIGPAGSAPAKSGAFGGVTTWRNVARQLTVSPVLQRATPSSDFSNSGWADTPLWSKLAAAGDADRITGRNGAVCVVALGGGGMVDPGLDEGHAVRYKIRRQDASAASVLVELMQGTTTVVASKTQTVLAGDEFVLGALDLTAAEAAAITSYSNHYLRLTATLT